MRRPPMYRAIVLYIFPLLFFMTLWGQRGQEDRVPRVGEDIPPKFHRLGYREGFLQDWVYEIFEDSRGFMWFGTQKGVSRYDGYRFVTFPENRGNLGPGEADIFSIAEDSRGYLWFATEGSLDRYDPGSQTFTHYRIPMAGTQPPIPEKIHLIEASSTFPGTIWAWTAGGLMRFDTAAGTFSPDPVFARYAGGARRRVRRLREKDGILWFNAPGGGMGKYDLEKKEITTYRHEAGVPGGLTSNITGDFFCSSREPVLWIVNMPGVDKFYIKTGEVKHYPLPFRSNRCYPTTILESRVRPGRLWIGTKGDGIYHLDTHTGKLSRYRHRPNDMESLPGNKIRKLFQCTGGLIWVGAESEGLCKQRGVKAFRGNRIDTGTAPGEKKETSMISLYQAPSLPGVVWVATLDTLYRLERRTGTLGPVTFKDNRPARMPVIGMWESPALPGELWLAGTVRGLYRYNYKTGEGRLFSPDPGKKNSAGSGRFRSIYEAPSRPGRLWLGTLDNRLMEFDIKKETFTRHPVVPFIPRDGDKGISCIHESPARPGVLWLGAILSGLIRFDMQTHERVTVLPPPPGMTLTGPHVIFTIRESASEPGKLWLGTTAGLLKFDCITGNGVDYPGSGLLRGYAVGELQEDDRGNLWAGTYGGGIYRFEPGSGRVRRFDIADGLLDNKFNTAVCKTSGGELYFGSMKGFIHFFPSGIKDNPYVPPVVLTDFLLGGRSLRPGELGRSGKPVLARSITEAEGLSLSYRDRVFAVEFAALNYRQTAKNRYIYKLEGFDREWQDAGMRRTATYTGIPHGKYLFRVKACNNDGVWNNTGRSLWVTVTPPWWRTGWAYAGGIICILSLLFGGIHFQRRRLIHRERERARVEQVELRARAAEAQAKVIEVEHRRKTHELEEARKLQLSLLPKTLPSVPDLEIAVYMNTATEVGGDYYDFYPGDDGSFTVAVGDATGHGLKAGTMVTIIKSLFMSQRVLLKQDIPTFLHQASGAVKGMRLGNLFMALTILRIEDNEITMGAGGMPPLYHFLARDGKVVPRLIKAPPLGAFRSFYYRREVFQWEPGDVLLLLSDGLPESFDQEERMFGYGRVGELLAEVGGESPETIIRHLVDGANDWLHNKPQDDDITFVVLKKK